MAQDLEQVHPSLLTQPKFVALDTIMLSEDTFERFFATSSDAMSIGSVADGRFLKVNKSFVELSGFSHDDALGRSPAEINILDKPEDLQYIQQLLQTQGRCVDLELTLRKKGGQPSVRLLSAEIIELNKRPVVLTTIKDITTIKKLENDVTQLERLNLVGQMAASMSHEIRNPLTTVRGFLQLMLEKPGTLNCDEYIELMISELDRANSIITEYLSLAKNKQAPMRFQNLNVVIQTLYPLLNAMANVRGHVVTLDLQDIPELLLNEEEIRQLLLNVVRNATEAMQDEGVVTIRTFSEGCGVNLAIEDQGTGIDPKILSKIGTPFFTTKGDGNGLGLAVCYRIASRHNATISLKSENTGTIISIHFPI